MNGYSSGFILETLATPPSGTFTHHSSDAGEIEGRTDKVKGLVLRTEFLKKA